MRVTVRSRFFGSVVRVTGDRYAGFYRVREGLGRAGGATTGVEVEAYRWGP
ncbi:hypothetical protein ACH495_29755 [Micromonospora sp. NPDC018662]|uniref:hypothetical protein n=1 Tax=Micromonospora sp. NPDC018662 TaxID=3364238 RepID=UPI0037BC9C8F